MYCPKCLNSTLKIKSSGIITVIINNKKMDSGKFLYDLEDPQQIILNLREKINDFFNWFSSFQNQGSIEKFELVTSHLVCENKCPLPLSTQTSVISILSKEHDILSILEEIGKEHNISIHLKEED